MVPFNFYLAIHLDHLDDHDSLGKYSTILRQLVDLSLHTHWTVRYFGLDIWRVVYSSQRLLHYVQRHVALSAFNKEHLHKFIMTNLKASPANIHSK